MPDAVLTSLVFICSVEPAGERAALLPERLGVAQGQRHRLRPVQDRLGSEQPKGVPDTVPARLRRPSRHRRPDVSRRVHNQCIIIVHGRGGLILERTWGFDNNGNVFTVL